MHYEKVMSSSVFKEPIRMVNDRAMILDTYIKRLEVSIQNKKQAEKEQYVKLISKLDALSPLKTLSRGYSIVEENGKTISSVKNLKIGDNIDIKLSDGNAKAKVMEVTN